MKCHAPIPDLENGQRVRRDHVELVGHHVEQDIAEPSAENDADNDPEHDVVELVLGQRAGAAKQARTPDHRAGIPPGKRDSGHVAERVPAQMEGAEAKKAEINGDQRRTDIREGQRRSGQEGCSEAHHIQHAASFPCMDKDLSVRGPRTCPPDAAKE